MLKSTRHPLSREQFTKLRDARRLIKQQFGANFSLQSDDVTREVYKFALQSDSNELFWLFSELNQLASNPLSRPLNEEEFVLLRQAKHLINDEFAEELTLIDGDVMDKLYGFALDSTSEELFDVYSYLGSRPSHPSLGANDSSSRYFRHVREAKRMVTSEFDEDVKLRDGDALNTLVAFSERSGNTILVEMVEGLSQPSQAADGESRLLFAELSAPDFERLREAKLEIQNEFDEHFSMHTENALDDLYGFALRSESDTLFDLFCDLAGPQMADRKAIERDRDWFSKEQFILLRNARNVIRAEFGTTLDLRSGTLQDDLYQCSLRATEEHLFDLCWEFQQLRPPRGHEPTLPSKDEFRMLRRAVRLVDEEFSEVLNLHADRVEYDLYKYAVNSESDELFDLFTGLMGLPPNSKTSPPETMPALLSKNEFIALRVARQLIQSEFGERLPLEATDVLDRLYSYALDSADEELFDLHADLNEKAIKVGTVEEPQAVRTAERELPDTVSTEVTIAEARSQTPKIVSVEAQQDSYGDETGLKRIFNFWGGSSASEIPQQTTHATAANDESVHGDNASVEAQSRNESFPDMVVRAVEQAAPETLGQHANAAAENPKQKSRAKRIGVRKIRGNKAHVSTTKHGEPPVADRAVAQQVRSVELSSHDAEKGWFIRTLDNRMRIRLSNRLSVGTGGELLLAAPLGTASSATIELFGNTPMILVQEDWLRVNGVIVEDKCELSSGDEIGVADTTLKVEYSDVEPQSSPNTG